MESSNPTSAKSGNSTKYAYLLSNIHNNYKQETVQLYTIFYVGKRNEMYQHSYKEHLKISKIGKFLRVML